MAHADTALLVCVARLLAARGGDAAVSSEEIESAMRRQGWSLGETRAAFARVVQLGELRRVPGGWRPASWANRASRLGETSTWRTQVA